MATQAQHRFEPAGFSAIRAETSDEVATLRADLIAVYQPVNSQELHAVERIALAQHSIKPQLSRSRSRPRHLAASKRASRTPAPNPRILKNPELTHGITVSRGQNHNGIWMAFGFHRMNRLNKDWPMLLRYQAQAERLFRRAIEEFERLRALRDVFPVRDLIELEPQPDPEPETLQQSEPASLLADPTPDPEPVAPTGSQSRRGRAERRRDRAQPETPVIRNCDS